MTPDGTIREPDRLPQAIIRWQRRDREAGGGAGALLLLAGLALGLAAGLALRRRA